MKLNISSKQPVEKKFNTPLLFIHGMWHASWCWEEFFVPYFVDRGFECHNLDLRGHGKSENNKSLRFTKISDYVKDVEIAVDKIGEKPVIVAHSMGGFVTQHYLTKHKVPAAVLLAPVPPWGLIKPTLKTMIRIPFSFLWANLTMNLWPIVNSEKKVKRLFFSDKTDPAKIIKYSKLLQNESYLAYLGMLLFSHPKSKKVDSNLLILGGELDWSISPSMIRGTAKRYNTEPIIFEGMAHDMMLDDGWEKVADTVLSWIKDTIKN